MNSERYGKWGRKVGWIVKDMEKCGRKASWIVKRYGQYGRKDKLNSEKIWKNKEEKYGWIVKWYGKYGRKVSWWNDMENMAGNGRK